MKRAFTYALPSLRLGHNNVGQLGRPEDPGAGEILSEVITGACGFLHTLLLRKDGIVYSTGKAAGGRLGNGNDIDDCHELHPSFKVGNEAVTSFSAGSMHNAFVTEGGDLFAWGYDSHGQVGIVGPPKDDVSRMVARPTMVDLGEPARMVSCSGFHTAAVAKGGSLYCWGRSDFGRCGVKAQLSWRGEDDTVPIWLPQKVQTLKNVSSASAGGFFTVTIMDDTRTLFAFGGNGNGELGTGIKSKYEWEPKKINLSSDQSEEITQLSCGGFHTCVLTSAGRVFVFGDNHSNQLGLEAFPTNAAGPAVMDLIKGKVTSISCGPTFTTLVTENTKLWLIGGSPASRRPEMVYDTEGKEMITLPEKQGAHHLIFFLE